MAEPQKFVAMDTTIVVVDYEDFDKIVRSIEPTMAEMGIDPEKLRNAGAMSLKKNEFLEHIYDMFGVETEQLNIVVRGFAERTLGQMAGQGYESADGRQINVPREKIDELQQAVIEKRLTVSQVRIIRENAQSIWKKLSPEGELVEDPRFVNLDDEWAEFKRYLAKEFGLKDLLDSLINESVIALGKMWINNGYEALTKAPMEDYLFRLLGVTAAAYSMVKPNQSI